MRTKQTRTMSEWEILTSARRVNPTLKCTSEGLHARMIN